MTNNFATITERFKKEFLDELNVLRAQFKSDNQSIDRVTPVSNVLFQMDDS